MQELIKKLTETVGISETQAIQSIETVTTFIKEKLPPMMHGMVDSFLGQQTNTDEHSGINDLLGGLMGTKTEEETQ
jgi:hypothetical protein